MPLESWTDPEETPTLASTATAMIDAALTGSGLPRETYWAAVLKGYNTPYNDPPPRRSQCAAAPIEAVSVETIEVRLEPASMPIAPMPIAPMPTAPMPVAAMAILAAEVRAA